MNAEFIGDALWMYRSVRNLKPKVHVAAPSGRGGVLRSFLRAADDDFIGVENDI